jgi:hypothetical protein
VHTYKWGIIREKYIHACDNWLVIAKTLLVNCRGIHSNASAVSAAAAAAAAAAALRLRLAVRSRSSLS